MVGTYESKMSQLTATSVHLYPTSVNAGYKIVFDS